MGVKVTQKIKTFKQNFCIKTNTFTIIATKLVREQFKGKTALLSEKGHFQAERSRFRQNPH